MGGKYSADGESLEIGFPQIVEYLWEKFDSSYAGGSFERYEPWVNFRRNVRESIEAFYDLVREFGEQELYTAEDDVI